MSDSHKPILAVTMGDAAGIGPEIAIKAFANKEVYNKCRPILMGNSEVLAHIMNLIDIKLKLNLIKQVEEAVFEWGTMDVVEHELEGGIKNLPLGEINAACGDLAFRCILSAIKFAMNGKVDATVTGPINKASINAAGHSFSGHTEIYAHYTNTKKYAMLLADENLKVIHVSTHVSLRKAVDMVKKNRIIEVVQLLNSALKTMGVKNPRIGVAGLNPHAGDNGLFGTEEQEEIIPAINKLLQEGVMVDGPIPPDSLFVLANGGRYDGCVAMYHDQGHIPFKVIGFEWDKTKDLLKSIKGVNITLGLPIIRTSVDHGTAFEIAGKGLASEDALVLAMDYALRFCSANYN